MRVLSSQNSVLSWLHIALLFSLTQLIVINAKKSFSSKEKEGLVELRPLVDDALYRDYMKDDMYLVQWLRTTSLDVAKANTLIRKVHKWRIDKKMEKLVQQDWSKHEKKFKYDIAGHDLEGRPIMTMNYGETWDLRKDVIAGMRDQFNTYMEVKLERTAIKARETFNNSFPTATGVRDVPDFHLIYDFRGYSQTKNGCLGCVPAILTYASDVDQYYAYGAHGIYIINCPRIFLGILQLIRNILSPRTNELLKVYDHDRSQWLTHFLTFIARDQLKPEHGGTLVVRPGTGFY